MVQNERLYFLLSYLLEEDEKYASISIPDSFRDRQNLLADLMSKRPATAFPREFRQTYTSYLEEEKRRSRTVSVQDLTPIKPHLYLWQGDLDTLEADVIVASAEQLEKDLLDGTVMLQADRSKPCSNIIYAAGPKKSETLTGKAYNELSRCYWNCLQTASDNACRIIAFHPDSEAMPSEINARIALETLDEFVRKTHRSLDVIFHVSRDQDYQIYHRVISGQ